MNSINRRKFLRSTGRSTALAAAVGPMWTRNYAQNSLNEGRQHARSFGSILNVRIHTLCDPDETLFAERVAEVEEQTGRRLATEVDLRKVLENPEIDAISVANRESFFGDPEADRLLSRVYRYPNVVSTEV